MWNVQNIPLPSSGYLAVVANTIFANNTEKACQQILGFQTLILSEVSTARGPGQVNVGRALA